MTIQELSWYMFQLTGRIEHFLLYRRARRLRMIKTPNAHIHNRRYYLARHRHV